MPVSLPLGSCFRESILRIGIASDSRNMLDTDLLVRFLRSDGADLINKRQRERQYHFPPFSPISSVFWSKKVHKSFSHENSSIFLSFFSCFMIFFLPSDSEQMKGRDNATDRHRLDLSLFVHLFPPTPYWKPLRSSVGFLFLTRAKRIHAISICKTWNHASVHTELCVKSIYCYMHVLLIKCCCIFSPI